MKEEHLWWKIIKQAGDQNANLKDLLKVSNGAKIKTLNRRWDKSKTIFEDNQEYGKVLYKACKICVILNKRNLNLKHCISALKAATHLLCYSENAVQEAIEELINCFEENIQNCKKLSDALDCWRIIKRINSNINGPSEKSLRTQVEEILFSIARENDIIKLKENFEFVIKLNQEEKVELKSIIDFIVSVSLEWIETEKENAKFCDEETLIEFENNFKKLEEFIAAIREEKQKSLDKLDNTTHDFQLKTVDENDKENSGSTFPKDIDENRIAFNRITFTESISSASESKEEQSSISIYKGMLDRSIPICVKIYYHNRNEYPVLFLKELDLIRNLSETNQCFLKYEGWFHELLEFKGSANVPAFAIVTEGFTYTLMDEIVNCSSQNQKYTYQEYQRIVICLLEAFALLESRGIMHNNIKPDNILITENRTLKIVEFNFLDAFLMNSHALYSNNADYLWKDEYLAPEIIKIHKGIANGTSIDIKKCDVYSLGLVFLQMYSLLPIAELNTEPFWSEIDCYVSSFKPGNVANLLKKMLAENSNERASFKESLEIFRS
ncbi:unnamed protein product [Blepharisma stoltei]|uniref:Protein kinase domain-containing protein n=1 Tax=Blepharisma stoltei TaxID=1481888 RepID=A0AAU9IUS2_9CILI|nr:unnamed protein product [Blepharisma stoltei]